MKGSVQEFGYKKPRIRT